MNADYREDAPATEVARLIAELDEAELYEQRLRQLIVEVRDQLAAGDHARALSMLWRSRMSFFACGLRSLA